jgi:dethiobiotin synthetase
MSARFLLVTGTDTGVGKTVIAAGLLRRLRERGRRVRGVKPVESGCAETPEEAQDGVLLALAAEQREPRTALCRLATPVAPPVAADVEAVTLAPSSWIAALRALADATELIVVESAGGLLSPLAWGFDAAALAVELGAAALVVAADRLGTQNHVLLTAEALRARRIVSLGVVLVAPAVADAATGGNAAALARCGVRPLFPVPRLAGGVATAAASDHHEAVAAFDALADAVVEWLDER